jgi:hypothetical protein
VLGIPIQAIPGKKKKDQDSIPNHFVEDKNATVPNHFVEGKNTQKFIISF